MTQTVKIPKFHGDLEFFAFIKEAFQFSKFQGQR